MDEVRCALIIANSQYEDTVLRQLSAPTQDAEALANVLRDPSIGGFQVQSLLNQPSYKVRQEIQAFFSDRRHDDLLLLYFSGHGVKDEDGQLYFATPDTNHKFLQATAVEANFVNDMMRRSSSRRQVLLLDCCHSGAFARGMVAKGGLTVGTRDQFEGRGRVVLTASDATQYSFEGESIAGEGVRSVFTSFLVNGLQTGEADRDCDGSISLDELYAYVHDGVIQKTPNQRPRKWDLDVEGEIIVARNPRSDSMAADLPVELNDAIASRFPTVRYDAVQELGRLLHGRHKGLALAAREALTKLQNDDSRRVSSAAEKLLAEQSDSAGGQIDVEEEKAREAELARAKAEAERIDKERAEQEQLAREKAEQERLARERAEKERVAAERAAAARAEEERARQAQLARQKSEAERVEKEKAERERLARQKAEQERLAKEKAERERAAAARAEEERARQAELARQKVEAERAEQERLARERDAAVALPPEITGVQGATLATRLQDFVRGNRQVIAAIAILLCAVSIWYFARRSAGRQETSGNIIPASSQPAGPLSTQSDAKGKRAAQAASAGAASELGAIVGKEVKAAKPVSQPAGASNAQPPASKPMQVGSQEMRSKLVYHPAPQYPQAAKAAHVQGMVRLYALIDRDGTVKGLKVISGHPLLVKAAMAGIEQWRYKPTLRNGQPVEVETEIDVNFTLEGEKNGIAGFESSNSGNQQTAKAQPTGPVNPPVPIYQPAAPYTDQARMNKIQGIVKLVVSIDAQGNVIGTKVITPLESSLDESAADTVRTWKFKPATQNGVPVPVTIAVNVDFKLY